jgi:hypothetical protein
MNTPNSFQKLLKSNFWNDSEEAQKNYIDTLPSDELIKSIEKDLGYKLPYSYIELMKIHNGGIPSNNCFPIDKPLLAYSDHIEIYGIFGISYTKPYSLCGSFGNKLWQGGWGYPDIGIYICDTPSAGHDMVALDYRKCSKDGEPEVVHVDQEDDYKITFLAKNFEEFILNLINYNFYYKSFDEEDSDRKRVEGGKFSELLESICKNDKENLNIGLILRNIAKKIFEQRFCFLLNNDALSYLFYDILFWLYGNYKVITTKEDFINAYKKILTPQAEFTTGIFNPYFINKWFDKHIEKGEIITKQTYLYFTDKYLDKLKKLLREYQYI